MISLYAWSWKFSYVDLHMGFSDECGDNNFPFFFFTSAYHALKCSFGALPMASTLHSSLF